MTLGQRIVVMKDGVVQQIDTPMALYRRPANLFVATFLGSPAMNVVTGRLSREGGWGVTLADGTRVPIAEGGDIDGDWHGRELHVGVRPEHLLRAGDADAEGFEAMVELVEPVGSEVYANLRVGGQPLVARLHADDAPPPGARLRLRVPASRLHVFDPRDGRALARG